MKLPTVVVRSTVTVYVPELVIKALSAEPGAVLGDQLAGELQLPPAVLVQTIVAAELLEMIANTTDKITMVVRKGMELIMGMQSGCSSKDV